MKTWALFIAMLISIASAQTQSVLAQTLSVYIDTHLPNSHPLKKELVKKLNRSGKVVLVTLPERADLILNLDETGRGLTQCAIVWNQSNCGNRGRAVLKSRPTGEELWSEEKGGAWQMSGWSGGSVGKKLGEDLVKFLSKHPNIPFQ